LRQRPEQPDAECIAEPEPRRDDRFVIVTAQVLPLTPGRPTPTGTVIFFIDGAPLRRPVPLDSRGWPVSHSNT